MGDRRGVVPLRVVQLTSSGNVSGGTRQALLLALGLRDAGHEIVFAAPSGSKALGRAEQAGFETWSVETGPLRAQWRAARRFRRRVRAWGAHIVHTHHTKAHNIGLLATFGGGFPPVVANRGVLFRPEFPAKFRSRRNAALITNSAAVKAVLEGCGVSPGRVHVVYNAKELPDLSALEDRKPALRVELGLEGPGPVVGGVGRGRPEKGYQFLVEAAPAVLARYPDARFLLVGSGMDRFVPRLRQLGVADRFLLPGMRTDAVDLMALMDVFVIPSIDMESCPNVLLEAMGAGCPVVGADTGGIAEVMVDGVTGHVVPPADAGALAGAVSRLLSRPDQATAMGRAGRSRVAECFSLETKVAETLRVYQGVLP